MAIYDCFTFFNEYEILSMRLEMYSNYVDYFVISECCKTQRGEPKSYNFQEHKNTYKRWENKIIYIKADEPPNLKSSDDWAIENYQRNCIMKGLTRCKDNDIIFISDIDEFYNPLIFTDQKHFKISPFSQKTGRKRLFIEILKTIKKNPLFIFNRSISYFINTTPISFEQDFFYYFMNYKRDGEWYGTVMTKYKFLTCPQDIRNNRNFFPYILRRSIPTGWHFSYLGGKEQIKKKLKSIIEGNNLKQNIDIDTYINDCLIHHKDIFGRKNVKIHPVRKEDIGIPNIDFLIREFPQFYFEI